MTTVQRWSGQETRLLRHALRLTVRAFAEDLGVCVRTVSKWEALGGRLTPRPELQAALDTMLRRAGADDQERFHSTAATALTGAAPTGAAPTGAAPTDAAPTDTAAGSSVGTELPVEAHQLNAALADARHYLDGAVVGYFRRQLAQLKADDSRRGTDAVLPPLLGVLGAIERHAGEVKPTIRRELLAVGADGADFAGWLYRDACDTVRARYWHARATEWAQEAGDRSWELAGRSAGRELWNEFRHYRL